MGVKFNKIPEAIQRIQAKAPVPMVAFHGSQKLKDFYLGRISAHRASDQLVKGRYWENAKGCAIGCTLHGSDHASYETELGVPRNLARLEDVIFERLDNGASQDWPERFTRAAKIGADLSLVWPKFAVWLLIDPADGVIRFAKNDLAKGRINDVAALWNRVIAGESVESLKVEFQDATDAAATAATAATAAAYAAATAAAYAAATDDAYAAATAAAYADAATAAAYADAAADDDATDGGRNLHWVKMSNKLIELMKAA